MTTEVTTLDLRWLGVPGSIGAFLVEGPSGHVLIETGPASCLEALEQGLADHGLTPGDIEHVLVTHIHFDHAGAAWWLARHGATIHVHEVGAKHLIDPSRLVSSAKRIYQARMDALWGTIEAIPETHVHALADGDVVEVAGLRFDVLETLGHARHHHAFLLDTAHGRIGFVGDAAGMVAAPSGAVLLPMPAPDLDVDAWHRSLDRLGSAALDRIWLTHFGPCAPPQVVLDQARAALATEIDLLSEAMEAGEPEEVIRDRYRTCLTTRLLDAGASEREIELRLAEGNIAMNLAGVRRWFERRKEFEGR